MKTPGKRGALIAMLACAMSLVVAAPAWAITIQAGPGADPDGYGPPDEFTINQGGSIGFNNADPGVRHDVTARGRISGRPLFLTPTITGPASADVAGTEYLTQGSYAFFCNVHPLSMTGTLNVTGNGTPVPRPDIEVKILTRSIERIANRGRVKVRVKALSEADDVNLVLKLGKRRIGLKSNLDLEAGQVRRVPIVLSNANRNRFEDRARARLKLTGTVLFGPPDATQKVVK